MNRIRLRITRMWSVRAVVDLGCRWARKGDTAGAAEAFQLAANSGDIRHGVRGALHLWILWSEAGNLRAANEAYRRATDLVAKISPDFGDSLAEKSHTLGGKIESIGDECVRPARLAFHRTIASRDPQSVPLAATGLAGLEWQAGDNPATRAAFQRVIDSGHPGYVPAAARWLLSSVYEPVTSTRPVPH